MIKKLLFVLLIFGIFVSTINGQSRTRKSKKEAKKEEILEHLWYGGGFNLGFNRTSLNNEVSGNTFFIGISPMVGYRVWRNLSFGPRLEFQYFTGRFEASGNSPIFKYNTFTYGGGIFMRYKFLPILFTHIEYDYLSQEVGTNIDYARGRIETERFGESLLLMGLGYSSGGILSTEIYLLYDVLAEDNTTNLPIQYRFGFTYNF